MQGQQAGVVPSGATPMAVSQAVQQAMQQQQQRQQGQPGTTGQALTDLAVNYMSAINAANYAKAGQAAAAAGGVNPMANPQQQGGQPGVQWGYPMMYNMAGMNPLAPTMLALQQQRAAALQQSTGYNPALAAQMQSMAGGLPGMDQRKSRQIKSPQQLKILKAFFQTNQRPTKDELRKLVKDTQLQYPEVTRWFRNERHKSKKADEAKMEAIQGHMKMSGGVPMHHQHGMHHAHMAAAAGGRSKRKREDGSEGGESDTGSDGEGGGHGGPLHHFAPFGLGSVHPPNRVAFIQSFIASLQDPTELDAAAKTLEAKRAALGLRPAGGDDINVPFAADAAWMVLSQQFAMANQGDEAKRRKLEDGKDGAQAVQGGALGPNGLDDNMLSGLTSMFAKHPEYLSAVQAQLQGGM